MPLLERRKPQRDPSDDAFSFLGGLFMGLLIGALVAIFLAPSDGPALRKRLKAQLGLGDFPDAGDADGVGNLGLAGSHDPLLTPRDVAAEERVAEQRVPAYSH